MRANLELKKLHNKLDNLEKKLDILFEIIKRREEKKEELPMITRAKPIKCPTCNYINVLSQTFDPNKFFLKQGDIIWVKKNCKNCNIQMEVPFLI